MNLFPKEIGILKLQSNEFKDVLFQYEHFDKGSEYEDP